MGIDPRITYWDTIEYSLSVASWEEKFLFFPRFCVRRNKLMWLKKAYRGTRIITGPGSPVVQTYWMNKEDYIWWQLKRNSR